jgi:glycosyltransferase involved in cell wall biosynthesis
MTGSAHRFDRHPSGGYQVQFVLSHPDLNTGFVREAGLALQEAGWPCRAVTNYVDRPEVWWRRLLSRLGRTAGIDLDREFRRRLLKSSPWTAIDTFPPWELARIAAIRAGVDVRLVDMLFDRGIHSLERRTIQAIGASTTHVYCYEYSARETFEAATRRGVRKIYEVPSPEYDFVERLLADELRAFPELRTRTTPYFERMKARRLEHRRSEWHSADLVVVNSTFTLKSFAQAGLDVGKVVVVPYGAPDAASEAGGTATAGRPLRFLWAGTFSIRKGAHHLLEAWRMRRDAADSELHIYGAWNLPDRLRGDLPPSIRFHGAIPQSELFQRYAEADVLVFPTLCDGFGMVVTEAFAHGLPVITTDRAGAADLVRHGDNGLIVSGGDVGQLAATLNWSVDHRAELSNMRSRALATAVDRPWAAYRAELAGAIADAFGLPRNGR